MIMVSISYWIIEPGFSSANFFWKPLSDVPKKIDFYFKILV